MSLPTIMLANRFINRTLLVYALVLIGLLMSMGAQAWEIDLTRRRRNVEKFEALPKKSDQKPAEQGFLETLLPANPGAQELVILSTEGGFIPRTVRLKKDTAYTLYVVNVNEKEKNISFILDAFSEHHGTYYGQIKKFEVTPKKEGIFSFYCPETSSEGRMVVYLGDVPRALSSQKEE